MGNIAIVGLSGAGKTVLAGVLAKFLSSPDNKTGVVLDPVNLKTQAFVDGVWEKLKNGQWPESTALGTPNDLLWRLIGSESSGSEFRILDIAGQEWFQLFGQEGIKESQQRSEQVQRAIEYCEAASIVLLAVNLADFVEGSESKRLRENEWATKFALDWLQSRPGPRRVAILITQIDLYGSELKAAHHSLPALIGKYLPKVYAAHVLQHNVPVLGVAAVAQTRNMVNDRNVAERVPSHDFRSYNLAILVEWIQKAQREIAISTKVNQAPANPVPPVKAKIPTPWFVQALIVAVPFVLVWQCLGLWHRSPGLPPAPIPVITWKSTFLFEALLTNKLVAKFKVRNDGADGQVKVTFSVREPAGNILDAVDHSYSVRHGEETDVNELDLTDPKDWANTPEFDLRADPE